MGNELLKLQNQVNAEKAPIQEHNCSVKKETQACSYLNTMMQRFQEGKVVLDNQRNISDFVLPFQRLPCGKRQ